MYNSISLSKLPGSSRIFSDFLTDSERNSENRLTKIINNIQNYSYKRLALIDAIRSSMPKDGLYEIQLKNLRLFEQNTAMAIVTGQQAGFLGGSLYTLLKAIDTVRVANSLKSKFPKYDFIPIFWVEDNDDDLVEASQTFLFDSNYNALEFKLNHGENSCVADEEIKDDDLLIIETALKEIEKYQFGETVSALVRDVYKVGNLWSDCFVQLYHQLIGKSGILFLSASKLMKSGIFKNLVLEELQNSRRSYDSVEKKNAELKSKDFHIQASPSEVNLFYHIGNKRLRIDSTENGFYINNEFLTINDLLSLAESSTIHFSPKVLLRPVFQDAIIPTIIYIAGPGEIAYHRQTEYLYNDFNVVKPALFMRTSATVIDKKISRYLSKIEKSPEYFFKSYPEIEKELANNLLGKEHDEIFSNFNKQLENNFSTLENYLLTIDKQLERSINGAFVKIKEQVEQLDKKAHSSAKRTNEELLQKYKACSNSIYPNGKPQERAISPLVFIAQNDNLVDYLLNLSGDSATDHLFIEN